MCAHHGCTYLEILKLDSLFLYFNLICLVNYLCVQLCVLGYYLEILRSSKKNIILLITKLLIKNFSITHLFKLYISLKKR